MNDKLQILAKGLTTCIVNKLVFNFILVFLNCLWSRPQCNEFFRESCFIYFIFIFFVWLKYSECDLFIFLFDNIFGKI